MSKTRVARTATGYWAVFARYPDYPAALVRVSPTFRTRAKARAARKLSEELAARLDLLTTAIRKVGAVCVDCGRAKAESFENDPVCRACETEREVRAEEARAEARVEDGQLRWSETGTSRRRG